MAVSLAISITRFHSWCVNVVKSGGEGCGWWGGHILAQSVVKAGLFESLKQAVGRKLHAQISPFLQINQELGLPFAMLDGLPEV